MNRKINAAFAAAMAVSLMGVPAAMAQVQPPASTGDNANAADQRESLKVNEMPSMGNKEAPKSSSANNNTSNVGSTNSMPNEQMSSDGSGKGEPKRPAPTQTN